MDNPTVEADVLTSEEDFLQAAKACSFVTRMDKSHERGALLICHEAQTGLGKLGTMWGYQPLDSPEPDILTISKHFGGGVSVSALSTTDDIADRAQARGFITGHFHQNDPLCALCSYGVSGLHQRARCAIDRTRTRLLARTILGELADRDALIGDIRGRGLLQGIELVLDRQTKEPAYEAGKEIERYWLDAGLLFSVRRGGPVYNSYLPSAPRCRNSIKQARSWIEHRSRFLLAG